MGEIGDGTESGYVAQSPDVAVIGCSMPQIH